MKMKEINPKILIAIAAIVIIVAIAAHYEATTVAVTGCYNFFNAVDGDGDPMPEKTRFDFFELKNGVWANGGSYTILPNSQFGKKLWLESDTKYKAVPTWYEASGWATPDDWTLPPEQIFFGCEKDRTFAYNKIICTPGETKCVGDIQYTCIDSTYWKTVSCAYGCADGSCNPTPSVPCTGLSPCNSDSDPFDECCAGHVWYCGWSNYDGEGFRMQWQLWQECDADCTCDGTGKECWCSDLTPDCAGLGICDHGNFLCDACCDGDVWECGGHYKWRLMESCTEGETCECTGDECLDCGCVATATPTPTPTPKPANIDDSTDTLTFDKSAYRLGDAVYMYTTGTNIGAATWGGKVIFTITQPNGAVYETIEQHGISVRGGRSETVTDHFQLPSTGQSGTWTAQSKWIDDDGNIHAKSAILDLGGAESEDDSMWIFGGIGAFLILLYLAYRKKQPKR